MSISNTWMGVFSRYKYGFILALILGIAFFFRVYFPYDNVFAGDWVRFQQNDPWYHMRLVENLVQNFPHLISFDPYGLYPNGQEVNTAPFFDLLLGFFAWLFGAGSPSKGLIETLGAYFPAILGALITVPIYVIGKALFNRIAGLIAAALIAILPGEFLFRTLLGFTDHHAAEMLFSTLFIMFLILALKSAREKEITFNTLRNKDWLTLRKPLLYSLLGGVALSFYLLSWTGGALFIFIIFVFAIVQYVIDHLRGNRTDYLCIIAIPIFIVALILVAPASGGYLHWDIQIVSLFIGLIVFLTLSGVSLGMNGRNLRPAYYPLTIAALIGIGLGLFYAIDSSFLESMLNKMEVLRPAGGELTISEAKGMSLDSAWEFFHLTFYMSIISLVIIGYLFVIKAGTAEKTLLFIWSLIMLIAAFGQQRFAYYLAMNVALLTAYLSWKLLEFAGVRETSAQIQTEAFESEVIQRKEKEKPKAGKKAKRKKAQKKRPELPTTGLIGRRPVYIFVALIVIFFLAFYSNILSAVDWAEGFRGPSDDWHDTLIWMRENTPEPFADPDFYYEKYDEETWAISEIRADLMFQEGTGDSAQPDSETIKEQYTVNDNTQLSVLGSIYVAQIFTPGEGHTVRFVRVKAFRLGSPGLLEVEIQGVDEHGHPDGNILTKGTIDANQFTEDRNGDWYTISVDSSSLSAGTQYAIVLRCPDGDWSNEVLWRADTTSLAYEDGRFVRSSDSGATWVSYGLRESSYGVMSWWDPGYWITYIGQRIPNASPNGSANAPEAAAFLLSQDESSANEMLNELGTKYVILDDSNAFLRFISTGHVMGELHAFIAWANMNPRDFYEVCYTVEEGRFRPILVYYPPYYQSMCSRLYIFGGKEWIPQETLVVSFDLQQATDANGNLIRVKVISDARSFSSYENAAEFIELNPDYRIIGREFAISPVPLEKLEHYELIYQSPSTVLERNGDTISQVEIFEYSP